MTYVYFSDSFVLYSCSCHVLLAEFRTSANLTGFHVFALMQIFAQIFYFRTGSNACEGDYVELDSSLCSVIRLFLSLYFMLCNKEEFQIELSPKIVLWQIFIGHRSPLFPLLSAACRLLEFDSSVICHVFMYC